MSAPGVSAFGDGSHAAGATGLAVDGGGFGAFPGSVWIYENADLSGAADELTVASWNDVSISVDIPGSLTNTAGTRYLFVQREDLAWSNGFSFTLEAVTADIVAAGSLSITGSADLDAIAALAAAGALSLTGAAELDAIGAMTAAGTLSLSGSASIGGSLNDIAASGSVSITGSADLDGLGLLVSSGTAEIVGAATLTASGGLSAAGQIQILGAALLVNPNASPAVKASRTLRVASPHRAYRVA